MNDEFNFIINEQKSKIEAKKITIDKSDLSVEKIISGDPRLVRRALRILFENAVKHTKDKSTIEINYIPGDESHVFAIKDQGPGFTEDLTSGEFKLFLTEDRHINLNMGLDLPYVNLIMLAHNGKITLKNYESGGIVELFFPKI